jgi:5-formyltetrahydrofolate cyclo-ligase
MAVEDNRRVRERIWRKLEDDRVARFPGARGRIPNFRGAEEAAARLAGQPEWRAARVVKSNPDAPQLPVRRRARRDGKTLCMAVPRLADTSRSSACRATRRSSGLWPRACP